MFEDSLVESTDRIRTRSSRYAAGSFVVEAALVAVIVVIPYVYPSALPRKYLTLPLVAPAPPAALTTRPQYFSGASAVHPALLHIDLTAPSRLPSHIAPVTDDNPANPPGPIDFTGASQANGPAGAALPNLGAPPAIPRVRAAKLSGPVRVSAGVAAGQLLTPIRPEYPAIAREARIQGTVVVAATISTTGRIENLRVVSGPPMLASAAVEAIRTARYRPYELNGEPVEVETTINVVFSLGSN